MSQAQRADDVVVQILLDKGYLTKEQLEGFLAAYRDVLRAGSKTPLLKFLQDRGLADEKRILEIRRELLQRGIYPKIGEYDVIEKLGEGGMGAVYKARHPRLETLVAIKVLLPEIARDAKLVQRFEREAKIAAKLQEADIIHVLDVQKTEGRHFIVMEFVDGEALDARLEREGALPEDEALRIVRDAARTLHIAHEMGIVHRDVKPSNLMITKSGKVKVGDLGLGKDLGVKGTSLTGSGAGMGSPMYMAPEQASNSKGVDRRADIYSLGATLYHITAGDPPFSGDTSYEIVVKHMTEPLKDPRQVNPTISEDTAALICRMMEKDPAKRIPTCAQVADEAERIRHALSVADTISKTVLPTAGRAAAVPPPPGVTSGKVSASEAAPAPAAPGRSARWKTVVTAVSAGVLCVLAVVVWVAWPKSDGLPPRPDTEISSTAALAPTTTSPSVPPPKPVVQAPSKTTVPGPKGAAPGWEALKQRQVEGALKAGVSPTLTLDLGGGVTMKLAYIPPGEFLMGNPENLPGWQPPSQHRVRITKGFYMGVTEVTQAQYEAVMGNNPASFKGRENPVENLSWEDAVECSKRLSARTGREVRLPTDAEWEYACRAGTATRYFFGDADGELGKYAWYAANSGNKTNPVGQKLPNAWGLYDMIGNITEWCQDWAADWYYAKSPLLDPTGPATDQGQGRVLRGAAYGSPASCCRVAWGYSLIPGNKYSSYGFRVVCNEGAPTPAAVPATPAPSPAPASPSPGKTMELDCGGGVTMKLAYIPPGEFLMGSPDDDPGPQHRVRITKGFSMGITEVTQAQYEAVMGKNPSTFKGRDNPVENVSWNDAAEYCKRLSTRAGREVRLPTEAEWEYACRAGTTTHYFCGDAEGGLGDFAWYGVPNNTPTKPVGQKRPNPWGLYDMSGNVCEWCQDWWAEDYRDYYGKSPSSDPTGPATPATGLGRVLRGGAYPSPPDCVRSAFRTAYAADTRHCYYGFRVVCNEAVPEATAVPATPPSTPASASPSAGKTMELDCGGGVTMKLAYIPAGEFLMGSPDNEPGRGPGEGPQHRVRITKGFYIAVTHVTQAQYEAVMGNNPSTYKGRENPVETMLWNDAVEFCKRLSARTGREVRLPTEAEWEYACRAGTTTRYFFGDADGELSEYAWWKANTGNTPKPVGQKRPNPWGLYDMGGNVWQFCQDWYADKYYGESPLVDPPGPAVGQLMGPAVPPIPARVVRGAAWNNAPTPGECRSATRDATDPNGAPNVGFRVVCNEAVPGAAAPAKPTAGLSPGKTVEMDCGGVPMKLTYIPPGDFLMGSPENEAGRYGPEGPQHRVRITKAFYMGVTEVTQAQYEAIMGKNPSTHRRQENPVETVLWSDAVEFCKRLSTRTGREVRLPTEAEWEYACRAGTTTRYFFGDAEGDLGDYAWYQGNNSPGTNTPKPVGRRLPNPWGLYDIYGNVLEWCQDWYDERYYGKSPVSDPTGPMVGQLFGPSAPPAPARAVRGSFWNNDARELRSAWRGGSYAHVPVGNVGFRVVCAAE